MIKNDQELQVTLDRIAYFQRQVKHLRHVETNQENYRLSVSGYMAELDRMNLEVRDYLWLFPSEPKDTLRLQLKRVKQSRSKAKDRFRNNL